MTRGATALLSLERPGSAGLLWVAHSSAATAAVTGFLWNGSRFGLNVPTYEACKSFPPRPLQPGQTCDPG